MPATEAQKRAMKKWREDHKDYFAEYYRAHSETMNNNTKISQLKRAIAKKQARLAHQQELLTIYESSRSKDSPITTDEDSS